MTIYLENEVIDNELVLCFTLTNISFSCFIFFFSFCGIPFGQESGINNNPQYYTILIRGLV